jgi:hypothetical protein
MKHTLTSASALWRTLVLALLYCLARPASAVFVTDEAEFDAGFTGTTIDFEGYAPAGTARTGFSSPDVTFGYTTVVSSTYTNLTIPVTPSDWLCNSCYSGAGYTYFDLPGVNAVGLDIAMGTFSNPSGTGGQALVQAFNGATLLDQAILSFDGLTSFDSFVGIYGLGLITRIVFDPVSSSNFGAMDNLRFGEFASVPEPSTLALMGMGLVGIGFAKRNKTWAKNEHA